MIDFEVWKYTNKRKMALAGISERRKWRKLGVRRYAMQLKSRGPVRVGVGGNSGMDDGQS
jgi:hypothetical protein